MIRRLRELVPVLLVVSSCGGSAQTAGEPSSPPSGPRVVTLRDPASCEFAAPARPTVPDAMPSAEATAAYERGVAATTEGSYEVARAAYAAALAADPAYSTAAYDLGVSLVRLDRIDEAIVAFETTTRLDPASIDAFYNLGLLHAGRGEHESALDAYRHARALAPREFDLTKKVAQELNALGRFEEAEVERLEARRIRDCSDDPALVRMTAFVIEQLSVDGETVFVYEVLEPDPTWTVHYAFRVVVDDAAVRAIQLESDPVSRESGVAALFGVAYPDSRHLTTSHTFRTLPRYGELRATAIELVRASRNAPP